MGIKKILLVSEYSPGALAWNCLRTLSQLGYEVTPFSCVCRTTTSHAHTSKLGTLLKKLDSIVVNKRFLRAVARHKPDLIFCIKAETITYKSLRAAKTIHPAQLVNWYPDNPFTLWNGNSNAEVLKSLPLYDSFAIWSDMLIEPLQSAGCAHVQYTPFGYDAELYHKNITLSDAEKARYMHDVSFIGSWDTDRQWWLDQLVARMPNIDLAIWGNGWNDCLPANSALRKFVHPALINEDMIKALRCSAISLNFLRRQNMTAHNMRTIEIPAAGGFQLAQRSTEHAELLFQEHENIACFATPTELIEKVRYYLAHTQDRDRIKAAAHQRVQQYQLSQVLAQLIASVPQNNQSFASTPAQAQSSAPSPTDSGPA